MKITFTGLQQDFSSNTGLTLPLDTVTQQFYNAHLSTAYTDALSTFSNWKNTQTQTALTVIGQQAYSYPPGVISIESATVTQGTIVYPIQVVNSQSEWDKINMFPNITTYIPQYVFPRQYDFQLWPIPRGVQTITLNFIYSTPPLNVADYTTGTTSVTNASQLVTSSGGAIITTDMIGRYFVLTDATGYPVDYFYRITGVDTGANTFTLQSFYEGVTKATQKYIIGQVPELPDEAHILLSWKVTSDWYASRGSSAASTYWNNMYYTGDGTNAERFGKNILGGMMGIRQRYAGRADKHVVRMNRGGNGGRYPIHWINRILP